MKKFDEFINESDDNRLMKSDAILRYLKRVINKTPKAGIEDGIILISGNFSYPFLWGAPVEKAIEETNKLNHVFNKLKELKEALNADMKIETPGGNVGSYTIEISFDDFDKAMNDSNFIKSITGIEKYNL